MSVNSIAKDSHTVGLGKLWEGMKNAPNYSVPQDTGHVDCSVAEKAIPMICKIERTVIDGDRVVLRVSGRLQAEHIGTLKEVLDGEESDTVLDLIEVTLVDRDVMAFLAVSETRGIQLSNCPAFLREWISKERERVLVSRSKDGS